MERRHSSASAAAVGAHSVHPGALRGPLSERHRDGAVRSPPPDRGDDNRPVPSDDRTDRAEVLPDLPPAVPAEACGHVRRSHCAGSNHYRPGIHHGLSFRHGNLRGHDSQSNESHSPAIFLYCHDTRHDDRRGVHPGCAPYHVWSVFSLQMIWNGSAIDVPDTADCVMSASSATFPVLPVIWNRIATHSSTSLIGYGAFRRLRVLFPVRHRVSLRETVVAPANVPAAIDDDHVPQSDDPGFRRHFQTIANADSDRRAAKSDGGWPASLLAPCDVPFRA